MAPLARRRLAWQRLARDLEPAKLESMIEDVPITGAIARAQALMQGQTKGRIVVTI
jgi:acrylyl-CoA reductase (NADPH)